MSDHSNHPGINRIRTATFHLGLSLIVLVLAPVAMPPGYDQVRHWISELASNGTSNAWIAKAGFLWLAYAIWRVADAMEWEWLGHERTIARSAGLCLIPIAVFDHRPWVTEMNADPMQNYLHYGFATLYFACLAALVAARVWRTSTRHTFRARFGYFAVMISLAVPVNMVTLNQWAGLLQRIGLAVIFAWVGMELWRAHKMYDAAWMSEDMPTAEMLSVTEALN